MNNKKSFWLTISPYCFISVKKSNVLIYDTLNHIKVYSNDKDVANIVLELTKRENGYCIEISNVQLNIPVIFKFVSDLKNNFIGDIIDIELSSSKPVQLVPEVFFEKNINIATSEDSSYYHIFDLPDLLKEVTIQITNSCMLNCYYCDKYFKQVDFCFCSKNENKELPPKILFELFDRLRTMPETTINIRGGDITHYSQYSQLREQLFTMPNPINFILNIHSILEIENIDLPISKNCTFTILFNGSIKIEDIKVVMKKIDFLNKPFQFKFIITSLKEGNDVFLFEYLFKNIPYLVEPFYTGDNLNFFNEYVLLNKADIGILENSLKQILSNKTINSMNFGKLYISSNGDVYSNYNKVSIGNIINDSLFELVFKELSTGVTWKNTRINQPCSDCLNQYLCPPPSNYEIAIGKENLCTLY